MARKPVPLDKPAAQETPQQQFDRSTQLRIAEAKLGFQVAEFLRTPVGEFLLGRAQGEVDQALQAFREADPEDTKKMRAIQNAVLVPESFVRWLQDAIINGNNAVAQQNQLDDSSGDD